MAGRFRPETTPETVMSRNSYDHWFFEELGPESEASAKVVVPLVCDIMAPASVIDLGCGAGSWLAEFARRGVRDYLGVDGEYVPAELLQIPSNRFLAHDLRQPIELGRRYDMAMSLEVAEHLPAEAGDTLVQSLTALSDVVLFSAAVPGQGGTDHINEQWPTYWFQRFAARGFLSFDLLRPMIWNDSRVSWWYRQNLILYTRRERVSSLRIRNVAAETPPLSLVHPVRYQGLLKNQSRAGTLSLRQLLSALPAALVRAIQKRIPKVVRPTWGG
jgi:methyltransferase family protein